MEKIFVSDLKRRRNAKGMTLQETADAIGKTKDYMWRIESGRECPSMDTIVDLAKLFDGLAGKRRGILFFFVPEGHFDEFAASFRDESEPEGDSIPNDEQLNDLDAAEHISNVRNRASDMVEATNLAERRWLAIRNGCTQSREHYIRCYAQAFSLKWAVDGFIEDGEKDRPDLVDQGRRIALGCRPGYEGGGVLEVA